MGTTSFKAVTLAAGVGSWATTVALAIGPTPRTHAQLMEEARELHRQRLQHVSCMVQEVVKAELSRSPDVTDFFVQLHAGQRILFDAAREWAAAHRDAYAARAEGGSVAAAVVPERKTPAGVTLLHAPDGCITLAKCIGAHDGLMLVVKWRRADSARGKKDIASAGAADPQHTIINPATAPPPPYHAL
jgi:hypothetical protein